MRAKGDVATEKQRAWEYNQKMKFEEEAAAKSQLTGAAIKNIETGVADVAGATTIWKNKPKTPSNTTTRTKPQLSMLKAPPKAKAIQGKSVGYEQPIGEMSDYGQQVFLDVPDPYTPIWRQ
jgi:hypothetical protein